MEEWKEADLSQFGDATKAKGDEAVDRIWLIDVEDKMNRFGRNNQRITKKDEMIKRKCVRERERRVIRGRGEVNKNMCMYDQSHGIR